jgi:hypothetical protein
MRSYIVATLCLVITFAAIGCGSKKGGSKASMRARSGTFDGNARKGQGAGQNTDAGGVTTTTAPGDKDSDQNKPAEACKNNVESIAAVDGEEKIEGELESLKDPASTNELVLESLRFFFEINSKSTAGQIEIDADSFVDNTASDAVSVADNSTEVVCVNNANLTVGLPNRIDLRDGSYKIARQFIAGKNAKVGSDNKITSFAEEVGSVESDEYLDKIGGKDKTSTHIFSKDKAGNVYWRMKRIVKAGDETKTYVMLAKYKQQAIPAADATTSGSAKP